MANALRPVYIDVGGIELAYAVVGTGPPTVVRVPPLGPSLDLVGEVDEHFLERLAAFAEVVLFDRRGQGLSDRRGGLGTAEDRMDDIGSVMDAAGVDRGVLLADHDAVCLALLFAATYPDRVTGLVLSSVSAPRTRWAPDYPAGIPDHVLDAYTEWVGREWGSGKVLAGFFKSEEDLEERCKVTGRLERSACTPRMAVEHFQRAQDMDVRAVLPAVQTPTLVLHGTQDVMPVAWAEFLVERLADATLVTSEGHGLMGPVEESDPLCDEIEEFVTGRRPRPRADIDRVLATVLFVDIAGSTEKAAAMGDRAWRALLDDFRLRLRDEIRRYRGREINTRGDDVLATFDGTTRGVRCAQAISDRVARELGIAVRAGVHTGEVEVHDDDVAGIAVHIGARVSGLANPHEVLVTSTVRDLVAGSGLEFVARGSHELRGVPGTWELHALLV